MQPGDHAVLERRTPLGPGSSFWLDPGQEVTVVRVGERYCAVEAYSHVIVVRARDLAPVLRPTTRSAGPPALEPPTGSDGDEWWDDVSGRLGG
jgi:hypothetical protein